MKLHNPFTGPSQVGENEDLYIRILLWTFRKQESGFRFTELQEEFSLTPSEYSWVNKVFLTTGDGDRKYFEQLSNDEKGYIYALNEKGISAAITYLALKDSEKTSRNALIFAGFGLLATAVGIILQVQQNYLTAQDGVSERVVQAVAHKRAEELCKADTTAFTGLFDTTGDELTCAELGLNQGFFSRFMDGIKRPLK